MKIFVTPNYQRLSEVAADYVSEAVRRNPSCVLGLATGDTPAGLYQELVQRFRAGEVSFAQTRTFNLDEYVGLAPENKGSYHYYMNHNLFQHIDIHIGNVHIPVGTAPDLARECERYERAIMSAGGIELQVVGIGRNGHIGFNEPGSRCDGKTSVVNLQESTIQANSRNFRSHEQVPTQAISMGIGTILRSSRQILLLASGDLKADAVREMLTLERPNEAIPASCLRLHHNVTVVLDRAAASKLSEDVMGRAQMLESGV